MSIISFLLSILLYKCIDSLQDFRITLQIIGDRIIGDGLMVRSNCISGTVLADASPYSDWALGPAEGLNAMSAVSIGIEQCGTGTIQDTDIRICVQVASSTRNGQMQCTDWASDGAGGWSDFAETVDNDHVYKARIMIDTRAKTGLSIADIDIGMQASDANDAWGKSRYTGFIEASDGNSLYTRPIFGRKINNPIEAIKVYFEADIGGSWCCALSKGKPKYSSECTTDEKSASKEACEKDTSDNSDCAWSDCSYVGYCKWDGVLGRSTKEKRTCAGYTNEVDCNQGNGGRSGCEWQRGPAPEWYQMDEDYNASADDEGDEESDFEEEDWFIFSKGGGEVVLNKNEINYGGLVYFVSFLSLFLVLCVYGIRKCTNDDEKYDRIVDDDEIKC